MLCQTSTAYKNKPDNNKQSSDSTQLNRDDNTYNIYVVFVTDQNPSNWCLTYRCLNSTLLRNDVAARSEPYSQLLSVSKELLCDKILGEYWKKTVILCRILLKRMYEFQSSTWFKCDVLRRWNCFSQECYNMLLLHDRCNKNWTQIT